MIPTPKGGHFIGAVVSFVVPHSYRESIEPGMVVDGATSRIPLPAILLLLVWRHRCRCSFSAVPSLHPMEFSSPREPALLPVWILHCKNKCHICPACNIRLCLFPSHSVFSRSSVTVGGGMELFTHPVLGSNLDNGVFGRHSFSDVSKGVACHIHFDGVFRFIQK